MKAVSMFNCICSLGLALTCVLLLLGSPQAADAQSAPADASNIETLTSPSATFDSVEVVQGGKILKLRADGAAVDVQSQTHSLYLHSSGPGACPHACNNVLINPFGGEGNVGIGTIEPSQKLHISGNRIRLQNGSKILDLRADGGDIDIESTTNDLYITSSKNIVVNPYASNGNVGIGTDRPQAKLDVAGTTRTKILQITGGADLAELFEVTGAVVPGQIVAIDADHPGVLRIANTAYDRTVAGVISGAGGINPGLTLQQEGSVAEGSHPVALTGRVYVWADATYGSITPGDLLTTSDTPGHAMRVTDHDRAQGTILGKAMSRLDQGTGLVLVLVTLQ